MTTANSAGTKRADAGERPQQQAGQRGEDGRCEVNVGSQERLLSAGAGALLTLYALSRIRLSSVVAAGLGVMLLQRAVSGHCGVYQSLGLNTAEGDAARPEDYFERGIHVEESYSVDNKSPEELYQFWHGFENLPRFMTHLESVAKVDEKRSHWVARGPMGARVEWDAEIINDEPNHLIAWRSLAGADVDNAGSVRFVPAAGGRGTQVSVTIDYIPPAGRAGAWVAKLFGKDADQMVRDDLRNFKRLMETGDVPRREGQAAGA